MRTILATAALTTLLAAADHADAQDYFYSERYTPTGPNSYIYDRSWGHDASAYRYDPWRYRSGWSYGVPYGGRSFGRYPALPPYGFGDPSYSGYNDPYFNSYGPAVQDFLRFGGADFYGF